MKHLDQFSYTELMPVLSTEGMRALDKAAKEAGDATAIEAGYGLMKQAGAALFKKVVDVLNRDAVCRGDAYCGAGDAPETQIGDAPRLVAVFVGGGNNGGDGLVLAKLLIEAGIPCTTYSLAAADKFQNEAKMALDDFAQAGGRLTMYSSAGTAPRFADFNLIVDCAAGVPVVAADAPTGYDSQAHGRREPCTHALETLMFGFPRLDAYTREGGPVFGNAAVAPLCYPEENVKQFDEKVYLATEQIIPQMLPERDDWGDKRTQGCAMIVAGSGDMPGAAALCTGAALRSGAGLVTLASPDATMPVLQAKLSEPVFVNLQDIAPNARTTPSSTYSRKSSARRSSTPTR